MGLTIEELVESLRAEEAKLSEQKEATTMSSPREIGECSHTGEEEEVEIRVVDAQIESDEKLAVELQRKEDIKEAMGSTFTRQKFRYKIVSCDLSTVEGKTQLKYKLSNHTQRVVNVDELHTLGFKEWIAISQWVKKIPDQRLRHELRAELTFLIKMCQDMKLITEDEYKVFCVSNKIVHRGKSAGLISESKGEKRLYPIPEGVVFIDRSYVKIGEIEGLCFKDANGVECFQVQSNICNEPLYHCIALLGECKDTQSKPFRKRLISWLFNNLFKVKKIGGFDKLCEEIILEFQEDEHLSDEDLKTRLKWKKERIQEERAKKRMKKS